MESSNKTNGIAEQFQWIRFTILPLFIHHPIIFPAHIWRFVMERNLIYTPN